MPAPAQTLDQLAIGSCALIGEISTDCGRANRIASLGFIPGHSVRVTRIAPLGDPITVELDGREISLRRAEAKIVSVSAAE
jgi:Fe2+ transport system protein FeoA